MKAFDADDGVKFSEQDYSEQNSGEEVSHTQGFLAVFKRDLVTAFRQRGDMINPVVFFLMVVTMMPLGRVKSSRLFSAGFVVGHCSFGNSIIT